jgi:hypothetical protein
MNRITLCAAAIAAATTLLAPAALADDGQAAGKRARKPMPTFEQIDTNKDGGVTQAELGAAFGNRPRMKERLPMMFKRIDGNGDAKIEKAEMEAWKAKRSEHRGRWGRHKGQGKGKGAGQGQGN